MKPRDTLGDISGMCSKIAHDHDRGEVNATDLVELRDMINGLRAHVARYGYSTVLGLVRPEKEKRT